MSDDETLIARADAALMPTYGRQPVAFVRGEGVHLFARDGHAYIDCVGGISMINVGHAHPAVAAAIADQAARVFASYGYAMEYPVQRYLRDVRFTLIGGGTSEILKLIIAKEMSQ